MPARSDDDLYSKNGNQVAKFSNDSILATKQVNTPSGITLEEINYKDLGMINKKSGRTWVILTASWCAECAYELENNAAKINDLKKQGINTVLIYTNYDIKHIQKEIFKLHYFSQAYVLNSHDYTSDETKKISKFGTEILSASRDYNKMPAPIGVPQNFFFSSGKLTMYKQGARINTDSVKYYFR